MTDNRCPGWWRASEKVPKMHTEIYDDFDETVDYEVSDPVLAVTKDGECVVARCCYDECGNPWWFDDNGTDYKVVLWQPLPVVPEKGELCHDE